MQGPETEVRRWRGLLSVFSSVCVSSYRARTIRLSPSPNTDAGESSGRTRTCSRDSALDHLKPDAVVLVPVAFNESSYIPKYQSGPLPPVRLKPEPRFPPILSASSHYPRPRPLLSPRAATGPKTWVCPLWLSLVPTSVLLESVPVSGPVRYASVLRL